MVSTVKERNGPGRVSRLVWIISAALGHGGCPWLSGTWPWAGQGRDSGPMCESSIKEVVGSVGSEAVGLYLKGQLFTICRD